MENARTGEATTVNNKAMVSLIQQKIDYALNYFRKSCRNDANPRSELILINGLEVFIVNEHF